MNLQHLMDRLWKDYTEQNPHAKKVYDLFKEKGEQVINDHIAFRTFDDPRVNVDVLAAVFQKNGYKEKGSYDFPAKHLFAKHYEHPEPGMPRIFISQLLLDEFSDILKLQCQKLVDRIPSEILTSDELIFSGNVWGPPKYDTYEKLREESEYAAWLYVNGFRANHFTVSINELENFEDIREVNNFLKDNGFLMNDSGGEVKGSPEVLLEQSSIKAGKQKIEFEEGTYEVPTCYYEFAKRYPDDDGELYSGFIARSADKIFESTDYYDKKE
jgi:hypothetical protein